MPRAVKISEELAASAAVLANIKNRSLAGQDAGIFLPDESFHLFNHFPHAFPVLA